MKYLFHITLFLFLLGSCQSNPNADNSEINKEPVIVTFTSELNPNKTDWDLNKVYSDTIEFMYMDDNYDYPYAFFRIKDNQTTRFVCDENIDNRLENGILAVEWKIDSLYEAGEGEELYYDQRLLSYTVIEKPVYFGDYLFDFMKAYSVPDSLGDIQLFLSDEIGFYTTNKNDLYCIIEQKEKPITNYFMDKDYSILNESLLGDFCDGYPNIEDGLYFESIEYDSIPWFEIPVGEHLKEVTFPLNPDYCHNHFKKVTIVKDEQYHVQLYFIELDKQWYLWAEDNCGCDA